MLLSVVSIAYNNLPGLKKTLALFDDSDILKEIEVVVVDGGSADGSLEFLKQQQISKNWVSEKDKGIYNAMNKGLLMAGGDYVWFLNSGDYAADKQAIADLLTILKSDPDAVYGETMMVDANGKALGTRSGISTRKLPASLHWKSFMLGMNVSHQSFVIRRSLAVPYNENYKYVSDIDWMITSLKNCRSVIRMDKVLACFSLDGFSSSNRKSSNRERYKVLQKHYGFLPNIWNHFRILIRKILKPSGL